MPVTVGHVLTATTPDDPAWEIRPSHWNSAHAVTLSATAGSEIIGAFSNSPTVSFGLSGGLVTASANVTAAPAPVNVTGQNGSSENAQTIAFLNANGITLGVSTAANAVSITGSHNGLTTAAQSNQVVNSINGSTGTFSFNVGSSLSVSTAARNITFGLASNITTALQSAGNYLTTARASNDAVGLNSAVSNVTATINSSGFSLDARGYGGTTTAITGNASITLDSGGLRFNGSNLAGVGTTITGAASITMNSVGIQFNGSNLAGVGTSATNASITLNSNGLAISVAAPGAGGNFSAGVSTGGNTVGDTGITGTRIVFAGGNNMTLSQVTDANGATITFSGANAGGAQTGISGIEVSNTTYTSGTVTWRNANGISFGSSGANGISASYTVPTVTNSSWTVSDAVTSATVGRLAFTQANGITMTLSTSNNGNHTVFASHNGLTSQSNQNVTAGNGGFAFQTLSFSNVNGISFGTSAGSAITASHNAITTGRASTDAIGLNTAQTNVTWTVNSAGLSLNAAGYAGTASTFNGANISGSMTVNSVGVNLSLSVAAPGAAAENNAINLLGANTAGNTTATGSTIGWSGINVTLSGTNNSQVVISAPATSSLVGVSGITISTNGSTISIGQKIGSFYGNMEGEWVNSTVMQPLQSTSHIQPFVLENPVSFDFIRLLISAAQAASSTAATTGNTQFSYGMTRSHNLVLYSRGTGASSLSLQSVMSTQLTDKQSHNVSANANSTQFSYSNRFSYQMSTGTTGFTYDYSSSAASLNFHISGMSAVTGNKVQEFQWASSLNPGQYWLMYGVSSSTQSQFTNQGTRWFNQFSNYGLSGPNIAFGTLGADTNNSIGPYFGQGSFTTAGGSTTASLPISAITTSGSHNKMFVQFGRIA